LNLGLDVNNDRHRRRLSLDCRVSGSLPPATRHGQARM
jgi:hypothetical protein